MSVKNSGKEARPFMTENQLSMKALSSLTRGRPWVHRICIRAVTDR
jgi:hypothetical protein